MALDDSDGTPAIRQQLDAVYTQLERTGRDDIAARAVLRAERARLVAMLRELDGDAATMADWASKASVREPSHPTVPIASHSEMGGRLG